MSALFLLLSVSLALAVELPRPMRMIPSFFEGRNPGDIVQNGNGKKFPYFPFLCMLTFASKWLTDEL